MTTMIPTGSTPEPRGPSERDATREGASRMDADVKGPHMAGSDLKGPDLTGKVAIVTGATGGIGYETALGLARHGAMTILAGRNPEKGASAVARVLQRVPAANVRFERLDLASLASVARFAATVGSGHGVVDILVNNAGVMGSPARLVTQDGFEQQFGVNYLGHFALTGHLSERLCGATGGGRVVSVASLAHRRAALNWGDLQSVNSVPPDAGVWPKQAGDADFRR